MGKKVKFRGTFKDKFVEKIGWFCRIFWDKLRRKTIGKKQPILWLFLGQISLEIDQFSSQYFGFFCEFTWIFFGSTTTQNMKSPE